MKLDETKVYSLEGMTESQLKSVFDHNCPNLFYWIPCYNGSIATSRDLIYFNKESGAWNWVCFFKPKEVVKLIDLIN